jgi:DNA-directed RNA polymerase specialized sigma24 family protein
VAEDMGIGEGTVKTTLHEARTRLRRLLSEDAT